LQHLPVARGGSSGSPEVRIERLVKRFPVRRTLRDTLLHPLSGQRATVLRDVSLEVRRGEFFGLLGPNGAGKSTLFKILSTVVLPDSGAVQVAGVDVRSRPAAVRKLLGPVVPEERSLFWRISARENLRAYAALQGLRGRALHSRVDDLLELVELADAGEKMVAQFSSGMKQRLLVARALLGRPRILLLDEPTRSLDPISARRLRAFLREEVAERHGCTVLLATHNADEALGLCDRVGVLNRGRLLRVGTPGQLLQEMGDERYRLCVPSGDVGRVRALSNSEVTVEAPEAEGDERWRTVQLRIAGGPDQAAAFVAELARAGVGVSRFEPVQLTLAELIERVVERHPEQGASHV
jgi:ABC-type multidrug transport system ATPase subunit